MPLPSDRIGSPAAGASPSIPMIPGHCRPETATRDATRLSWSVPFLRAPPAECRPPETHTPHPRPRAYSSRFQPLPRPHPPHGGLASTLDSSKRKQNKNENLYAGCERASEVPGATSAYRDGDTRGAAPGTPGVALRREQVEPEASASLSPTPRVAGARPGGLADWPMPPRRLLPGATFRFATREVHRAAVYRCRGRL